MIKVFIGVCLVIAPFAYFLRRAVREIGWRETVKCLLSVASVTMLVAAGVHLILN